MSPIQPPTWTVDGRHTQEPQWHNSPNPTQPGAGCAVSQLVGLGPWADVLCVGPSPECQAGPRDHTCCPVSSVGTGWAQLLQHCCGHGSL